MPAERILIIAYDIPDDRRRTKLSDFLMRFGTRVNYSVFECKITDRHVKEIKTFIAQKLRPQYDRVLFYYLCRDCFNKAEHFGISYEGSVGAIGII